MWDCGVRSQGQRVQEVSLWGPTATGASHIPHRLWVGMGRAGSSGGSDRNGRMGGPAPLVRMRPNTTWDAGPAAFFQG